MILFIAVRLEAKAIARALRGIRIDDRPFLCADTTPQTMVYTIGIGASRLRFERPAEGIVGIIMAGLAGALDPTLQVGDVVVEGLPPLPGAPGEDRGEGSAQWPLDCHRLRLRPNAPPDSSELQRKTERDSRIRFGPIHTASQIIATPTQKAELFHATGALAVDMEGAAVRKLATSLGVPLLHVRGISDTAATTLDPAILHLIDDVGRVRPLRLASALVRRPLLMGQLKKLGSDSHLAARRMAAWIERFLPLLAASEDSQMS